MRYISATAACAACMLEFSQPTNHERFHAWLFDMLHMKICGSVSVPGEWDYYAALNYLERRLRHAAIVTEGCDDDSAFRVCGKTVYFEDDRVVIIQD